MSAKALAKKANPEQEKAIYHRGGKILSAGAGSGKTFVLIEHLVYLLTQIKENTGQEEWNRKITSELSKIVLMTFTKKAAGEMSVRMMRKVEELISTAEVGSLSRDLEFWKLVRQNLSFFNITTIHGFCHRLLGFGFWPEFPQTINLVSSLEHKDKIQKLFDRWLIDRIDKLDEVFQASSQALMSSMVQIFSSPELRLMWSEPRIPSQASEEINHFLNEFVEVKGYGTLFGEAVDLVADAKESKKKWFEYLDLFEQLRSREGMINASNLKAYSDFFHAYRFPTASKEMSSAQRDTLAQLKFLREDVKDFSEDLYALNENFVSYRQWVQVFADLFRYIDEHYFEVDGFSFADLEYYVLKALSIEDVLAKVRESFQYFIVDEFQDTSYIQFAILKKLIGEDQSKIFCVGDRKQAIYGFRGGELQVFEECCHLLGQENNYFLRNNFRSFRAIINYNNELFEKVFPLGMSFSGHDPHGVKMESQVIPESNVNEGSVLSLRTDVIGNPKTINLDYTEARILGEHILELLQSDEYESVCVLYRKLKPSAYLLDYFLEQNIAFSAQVKIGFAEDPLINAFRLLIEAHLNKADDKKRLADLFLLDRLFTVLGTRTFSLKNLEQFEADLKLYGVQIAFHKFVFSLGLTNSFYNQNSNVIDSICKLTKGDVVKIYNLLNSEGDEQYACEMMSGSSGAGKKRVLIMSAHASKGLEFDAVLLGGIHTNGKYNGMRENIGKLPHSFRWKSSIAQRKFSKSPFYHLESEILRLKDFSESKRLLYVACTRAVKHLAFVNLAAVNEGEEQFLSTGDNSWIDALRLIAAPEKRTTIIEEAKVNPDLPLIQQDSLGLLAQMTPGSLGMIAELSVTRLATIAACPFKFYLQNICKISPDEVPSLFSEEESDDVYYSSKKRGTEIHSFLSRLFLNEIVIENVPAKEKEKISWARNLAEDFMKESEIVSEEMIKFSFFGQMISGTPDLVFLNQRKIIVWDFKTGQRVPSDEDSYWFQLMIYGYAYALLKNCPEDFIIELSLIYLDEKEVASRALTRKELTQVLFEYWSKTERLDQMNTSHCSHCEYSSICHRGASSPSA